MLLQSRLANAKTAAAIVRRVALRERVPVATLYTLAVWPLEEALGCEALVAFGAAAARPEAFLTPTHTPHLPPRLRSALLAEIGARLPPTKQVRAHAAPQSSVMRCCVAEL